MTNADNAEQHLRAWSFCVEKSVDKAIADHHSDDPLRQPRSSLPGCYQGRCVPVEVRQKPTANPIRPGRHNDYQPPGEAMTMRSRHRVRQLRRIQSLLKRIQSQREQSFADLNAEWQAICKAKGYAISFVDWLLNWPDMIAVPFHVPTYEQLFHIEQIVRFDTDATVLQEVQARYQLRKYANTLDETVAFRRNQIRKVRGPQTPMITCLTEEHILDVHLSRRRQAKGPPSYSFSSQSHYDPQKTTYCGEHCVVIEFLPNGTFQVLSALSHVQIEHPISRLTQRTEHVSPAAIQNNVAKYWNHFWQRDKAEEQEADAPWRDFLDIADRAPAIDVQHHVEVTSLSVWKDGIRMLKNDSAPGVCGWGPAGLKLLPDLAILHLSQILNSFTTGWPSWLLVSRVVLLAKESFNRVLLSGRSLVFSYPTLHTQQSTVPPGVAEHNVTVARAFTKLMGAFVTFWDNDAGTTLPFIPFYGDFGRVSWPDNYCRHGRVSKSRGCMAPYQAGQSQMRACESNLPLKLPMKQTLQLPDSHWISSKLSTVCPDVQHCTC